MNAAKRRTKARYFAKNPPKYGKIAAFPAPRIVFYPPPCYTDVTVKKEREKMA